MSRGLSPVVGSLLLIALTVGLAAAVGTAALQTDASEPPPRVRVSAEADAATDRISVTHEGGDDLAVERLRLFVSVDGDPLAEQPPVPFFAAEGFVSGPTGPFNAATDGEWSAGQSASLRLASTNDPPLDPGDTVTVDLYHDRGQIASLEATA